MIAIAVILSILSTTGALCMAKDEGETVQIVSSAEQDVTAALEELDVPDEEKQELQQDLEQLSQASTETQKEKPRTKIKNWFKKHWPKVVGAWVAIVTVASTITLIWVGATYEDH